MAEPVREKVENSGSDQRPISEKFTKNSDRIIDEMNKDFDEIVKKYSAKIAEIDNRDKGEPTTLWGIEEKETENDIKITLDRMRKRSRETDKRIDKSTKDFYDDMDKISEISNRGIDGVLRSLERSSILDLSDEITTSQLVNMEDLKGLGPNYTPDKLEATLTGFVIDMIGVGHSDILETDKIRWAKMIWGREAIISGLQAKGAEEGVNISRDEIRQKLDYIIYEMGKALQLDPVQLRDKVNGMAFAFESEEGRKEIIKMAVNWERQKYGTE